MGRLVIGILVGAVLFNIPAQARPPIPGPVFKAVRAEWHTKAERVQAFKVAYCESKFRTTAVSPTGDYGLFQINRVAHDNWVDFGPRIFDVLYNARIARRLYDSSHGWSSPWAGSKSCWS